MRAPWSIPALLLALLVAAATPVLAADLVAQGIVYEDKNGNGRFDAREDGIAGVAVSDGLEIVETDADGRWELEIETPSILFVIKPRGYATPLSDDNLPRFYYIHQPKGSPAYIRYPGIKPTGPLPRAINFPLRKQDEPDRFEVILLADPQPQSALEVDWFSDDIVSELIGTRARFGMTIGDILYDDLTLFPRFNTIVGKIGIPWYNVPGNHEINYEAMDDAGSLETFKRNFGPPYYSFDYAEVHFVVLDNIHYYGDGESDPGDFRRSGGYEARIGKPQLDWLKRDLRRVPNERLVFVAMHAPLATNLSADRPEVNTQDRRELMKLLRGRPNLYAIAGHTHTTEHLYFGKEDGFDGPGLLHHHILTTGSGSWWSGPYDERGIALAEQRDGTPNGYHIAEFDEHDVKLRYKAAGKPVDYQMRIAFDVGYHHYRDEVIRQHRHGELIDGRMTADEVPVARVVVNLFDGGPRSVLEMRVGEGRWQRLKRESMPDPYVRELFARHRDVVKPWVEAVPSSHIFVADLPKDLAPGVYTLSVRAKDEFGHEHHAHQLLEISGSVAP
jgi:hypothetical protein